MNAKSHTARRPLSALAACVVGAAASGSLLIGWSATVGGTGLSTPITVGELREYTARLADRRGNPELLVRFERRVQGASPDTPVVQLFANRAGSGLAMH